MKTGMCDSCGMHESMHGKHDAACLDYLPKKRNQKRRGRITDKMRLDWLEKSEAVYRVFCVGGNYYLARHGYNDFGHEAKGRTARQAIDAAIKQEARDAAIKREGK